jgi:hypothetical protein
MRTTTPNGMNAAQATQLRFIKAVIGEYLRGSILKAAGARQRSPTVKVGALQISTRLR